MQRKKAAIAALLIAGATCAAALIAPSQAEARGPLYGATYPSKVTGKLWRGISNTAFCWVEIPIEINREIQHTDPFTGVCVGLGRGVWFTGQRLVLGVVDVVTFPVDVYGNNYGSKQRTEFPFIDEVE
jgi:putative exosortase-associated protein (TIGR04073 family)